MIKAVIFDVDGVLVNAEMFSRQYERDFGVPYQKLDPFFSTDFKPCLVGEADLKEALKPHLAEWQWNGTVDELLDYWFKSEHKINALLVDYIQELRANGILCFVATNQEKYRLAYMLDKMGFAKDFDGVFASSYLGFTKPNKEFFTALFNQMNQFKKSEILQWDDAQQVIDAAREFGIHAELYIDFENFKDKMKVYLHEQS